MQKNKFLDFISGLRNNHTLMMAICCLVPIIVLIAIFTFGVKNRYVFWGVLFLCPLMHIFMHSTHSGHKGKKNCH